MVIRLHNSLRNISLVILFVGVMLPQPVSAGTGGPYVLEWTTIDGGGTTSSGDEYVLTSMIGQPDADFSVGGRYQVIGGFLPGGPLCFVDFEDFARFAEYWLQTGTDLPADLFEDGDNIVNLLDLHMFVYEWLYRSPYDWPLK